MTNNGQHLEGLVALIEKLHLPEGFDVKTNDRIFNDEGTQIAEFDIEIRGKVGTTEISWLIECRDRPGQGPAPGSWIEQLVGRRTRFRFNKVTAVSTTGFAAGAEGFAAQQGIEIREVKALAPEHFSDWLLVRSFLSVEYSGVLHQATLIIGKTESEQDREAVLKAISGKRLDEPMLCWSATGERISAVQAFQIAVRANPSLYDRCDEPISVKVVFPDHHFTVDTSRGPIRIVEILFRGQLVTKYSDVPLAHASSYCDAISQEPIAKSAASVFPAFGMELSLEMHKLAESGETHIVLRKLGKAANGKQTT